MKKFDENLEKELIKIRHELHKNPEAAFEEINTGKYICKKLEEFGYKVYTNIGKTGLVGELKVGDSNRTIALRSDIDCIKVKEETNLEYKSVNEKRMHACGHDGHMATMLGCAKILADRRNFNGTVYFVFQPAEEPGYGARAMIEDGLFEKFKIDEIYGFHNMPDLPEKTFHSKSGGIMASEDNFKVEIHGKGGHASQPQVGVDPFVVASSLILAYQTIISRNISPLDSAVISCTEILSDGAHNVIPSNVTILGDTRTFKKSVSSLIEKRMEELTRNICQSYGASYEFKYTHEFYPTVNDKSCYESIIKAAKAVLGEEKVKEDCNPIMVSEDFGLFSEKVPGCYSFLGGKKDNQEIISLHNNKFNYNDENLIVGAEIFAELVKERLY